MTLAEISAAAGVLLAILFEYVPGLHNWYNALKDNYQRLIMLGCLVAVVAGALGLSCAGWLSVFACTGAGLREAIFALVAAIVANQGTHRILPRG